VALTCGWAARRSSLKLDCTLGLYATCHPLQVLNISAPSTPAPNGDLVLVANVSTLCGAAAPLCILTNVSTPAVVTQFAQLPSIGSQQLGAPVVSFNVRAGMVCLCVGCVCGDVCVGGGGGGVELTGRSRVFWGARRGPLCAALQLLRAATVSVHGTAPCPPPICIAGDTGPECDI
jgi:hypothetical protein